MQWRERAEKAEAVCEAAEHAMELGYFGDGSSKGYVQQEIHAWRAAKGGT